MRMRWLRFAIASAALCAMTPALIADADEQANDGTSSADAHFVIHIEKESQDRIGLALQAVSAAQFHPELTALGKLEDDPGESFVLRAPVAGFLHAESSTWPTLGAVLADGTSLGAVWPQLTPTEQLDLASQRLEAIAVVQETEAELKAARASYESKRALNADGKMVSDRQLEEAAAWVATNEAKLAAAQRKLDLIGGMQTDPNSGLGAVPLQVEHGGQVVDVQTGVGEFVDAGQVLLRVSGFDRLVARVELPLGDSWHAPSDAKPRISVLGADASVIPATVVSRDATVGNDTRGESWLLAIDNKDGAMRPGTPVIAYLPQAGEPLHGTLVPDSAVVRYGGLAWVFVQIDATSFERRAVQLHSPTPDGWFVTAGIEPGETIVESAAQTLLSEQFKELIEAEEESAE